jgi:hypothetical protein
MSRLVLLILTAIICLSGSYQAPPNKDQLSKDECRPALKTFLFSPKYPLTAEALALNMGMPEIQTVHIPEGFDQHSLFSFSDEFIERLKQDLISRGVSREFTRAANSADFIIRFNFGMISLGENGLDIEAAMAMKRKGVTGTKQYNENYTDVIDSQEKLSAVTEFASEKLLKNLTLDISNFLCP